MNAIRILIVLALSIGVNSALASSLEQPNSRGHEKRDAKLEKAAFKQQLKDQRAGCRLHPKTVACNDLKERQRMEKRQFKAAEKEEKNRNH